MRYKPKAVSVRVSVITSEIDTYIKGLHVPVAPFSGTHEPSSIISRDRVDEMSATGKIHSGRAGIRNPNDLT